MSRSQMVKLPNVIDLDIESGTRNRSVSQVVKLPNVIDPNTVKGYKKYEWIPDGINRCPPTKTTPRRRLSQRRPNYRRPNYRRPNYIYHENDKL